MASSAVRLATRSSSCCCWATSCWYLVAADSVCRSRSDDRLLAGLQFLLDALEGELALGELRLAAYEALLERLRLLAFLARLPLGVGQDLVRLLLGVEEGFLAAGVGVAFGVLDDAERLLLGAADRFGGDALAVGDPDSEHRTGGDEGEHDADEITGYRQHA